MPDPTMPDPTMRPAGPADPALLQSQALRYAAGAMDAPEAAAFEARLEADQNARDALSEAVRLSAAALGQAPPAPDPSFRCAIRDRLLGWWPDWLRRRAYRGHPMVWAGIGAAIVAGCTLFALSLPGQAPNTAAPEPSSATSQHLEALAKPSTLPAPPPRAAEPETVPIGHVERDPESQPGEPAEGQTVAEIWGQLNTMDHVEKMHEEEVRWRHRVREMGAVHPGRAAIVDSYEP